jgi:hypothetical protein
MQRGSAILNFAAYARNGTKRCCRRSIASGSRTSALDTDAPIAPALRTWLQDALPGVVTRRADRELFGDLLPPSPDTSDASEAAPAGAHP